MRLSVQASLRLNHAIHQGNHRLDRPLHISAGRVSAGSRHDGLSEWRDGPFDPDAFDLDEGTI
jgi:hypothetical protein